MSNNGGQVQITSSALEVGWEEKPVICESINQYFICLSPAILNHITGVGEKWRDIAMPICQTRALVSTEKEGNTWMKEDEKGGSNEQQRVPAGQGRIAAW